jgi:hypothetical protein
MAVPASPMMTVPETTMMVVPAATMVTVPTTTLIAVLAATMVTTGTEIYADGCTCSYDGDYQNLR